MSETSLHKVLDFWFATENRARWFDSTPQFDAEVADHFRATWEQASRGELAAWEAEPDGTLALVIVLDQFPLHIFRGLPAAFATEARAREVARRAIARGDDQETAAERRGFYYLPFMHSESPADQEFSVSLYESAGLAEGLKWARHHRELIRRFGRFPHRNGILKRVSTAEENAYLHSSEAFHG